MPSKLFAPNIKVPYSSLFEKIWIYRISYIPAKLKGQYYLEKVQGIHTPY